MIEARPVVGMYVGQGEIDFLMEKNTSCKSAAISRASQLTKVPIYLFSIGDVNTSEKTIKGTYFNDHKGYWEQKDFSYPDVLYVRGGTPSKLRDKYHLFRDQLEDLKVKNINGPAFNKWSVIKVLQKNRRTAPYVPDTVKYNTTEDLQAMLKKYDQIYIKACRGRKGQQVMKVKRLAKNHFEYRYYLSELHQGEVTFKGLERVIDDFLGNRAVLMQSAIDLPLIQDCICDMRAEVQRNGQGEIDVVEIMVRVSQPGAPITQHASSYLFDEFLGKFANYAPEEIYAIKQSVHKFLAQIYTGVEKAYGPYGEMGIDFAFDNAGRLWFIECNSRPAKVSLIRAAESEKILRAYINPLEYARYIYNEQA